MDTITSYSTSSDGRKTIFTPDNLLPEISRCMREEAFLAGAEGPFRIRFARPVMSAPWVDGLGTVPGGGTYVLGKDGRTAMPLVDITDRKVFLDIHASYMDYRHRRMFGDPGILNDTLLLLGIGAVRWHDPLEGCGLHVEWERDGTCSLRDTHRTRIHSPLDSLSPCEDVTCLGRYGSVDLLRAVGTSPDDGIRRTVIFAVRGLVMRDCGKPQGNQPYFNVN